MAIKRSDFSHLVTTEKRTYRKREKKINMEKLKRLETLVRVGKIILNSIPREKIESNLTGDDLKVFKEEIFLMGSAVRDNMGKLFNITGNPDFLIWEKPL